MRSLPVPLLVQILRYESGGGFPHSHGQESALPVIGMDYFFMTATGIQKLEELEVDPGVLSEGH